MLWTDNRFVTNIDMMDVDPEVDDVATQNSIVINGAAGTVQKTIEECGILMLAQMQRFGGFLSSGMVSANHLAAVFNTGGPGVNRTRILLNQIVAFDPMIPVVKQWVLYKCLERFYRAAVNRTLEDRYRSKMDMYIREIRQVYWPNVKNVGLPMVYRPMPAPASTLLRNPGTWTTSNVSSVTQAGPAGGAFDIAVTYVDQTFYRTPVLKNNSEGFISARVAITVPSGKVLSVSIATLRPPDGTADPADVCLALTTPLTATGWNVYVGTVGGDLYLQNATPIAIATTSHQLPLDPVLSGHVSDFGQFPDAYYTVQDLLQRG